MPIHQVCSAGHRWNPTADQRVSVEERWNRCPVCGSEADLVSLRDTRSTSAGDSEADQPRIAISVRSELPTVEGYDVHNVVGHGGMGVVYRARHLQTNRIVALKMVSSGAHASPNERTRFRTETESARRVHHANVVDVLDVGEQNGLPYVAFEYMDRGSLVEALGGAPLPPRYAAELIELLARGVQAAHDQGVLHRDIKPGNVMLATPPADPTLPTVVQLLGVPKITDFGLAKRMDGEGAMTRTGAVMGTPSYMAPEQAEGRTKEFGPALDVHALGALLYEALTGRPPFKGATLMETLDQVRTKEPDPPSQLVPGLPRDLTTICLKALAKEPSRRYGSAQGMADDLRRYLDGQTIIARPMSGAERGLRWLRKRGLPLATAAVVLTALGIAAASYFRTEPKPEPPQAAAVDPNAAFVEHFANLVTRRGEPVGIFPLMPTQARRRDLSYRFTMRKGKVVMVEAVDRRGNLTNEHNIAPYLDDQRNRNAGLQNLGRRGPLEVRPARDDCRWEYLRNDKGELTTERAFDQDGRMVWAFHYTAPTTGYYTDGRGFPRPRAGSGAAYVAFDFSPNGWTTAIRYRDYNGKPRGDNNDIFGRKMTHDTRGLVIRESFLGPRDLAMLHPDGYATEEQKYDEQGNVTERRFLGLDGRLARSYATMGWASETNVYNADGRLVEWRCFDVDGKPLRVVGDRGMGFSFNAPPAIIRAKYDERGRRVSREYFDADDKPGFSSPVATAVKIVYRYDHADNCVEESYFDRDGQPQRAGLMRQFDDRGQITEIRQVPIPPSANKKGKAGGKAGGRGDGRSARNTDVTRMKHDDQGRLIEESWFHNDGRPATNQDIHKVRAKYDAAGRFAEIACFDVNDQPVGELPMRFAQVEGQVDPPPEARLSRLRFGWDERGNLIEIARFRPDGKPLDGDRGLRASPRFAMNMIRSQVPTFSVALATSARVTWRYDDRGNVTEIAAFDKDDKPVSLAIPSVNGPARIVMEYDQHGKCTDMMYFGADGKRLAFAARRARTPPPEFEGEFIAPAVVGASRTTAKYNDDGRLIDYATLDHQDKPQAIDDVARREWAYDRLGNLRKQTVFGLNGQPLERSVATDNAEFTYDELGRLTSITYVDAKGQPVQTGGRPWAKVRYQFDHQSRLIATEYLDSANKPVPVRIVIENPATLARSLGVTPAFPQVPVDPDNLAERRMIQYPFSRGDELMTYDGKPVTSVRGFLDGKNGEDYGGTKELVVRRGDRELKIAVPRGPVRMADVTFARFTTARFLFGGGLLALPRVPTDNLHGLAAMGHREPPK